VAPVFLTIVLVTDSSPPPVRSSEIPNADPLKLPSIRQSSMKTSLPAAPVVLRIRTPINRCRRR
jgi:hypothetical protein